VAWENQNRGAAREEGRNGVGQEVCVGLGENLRKWGERWSCCVWRRREAVAEGKKKIPVEVR
jgi:hypothetical protein